MELWHGVIIGIVEGITEFLPVSSTGHMILTSYLLGIHGPVVSNFEVFIQLGAILAVVALYRERFARLFEFNTGGFSGWRGWILLGLVSLPILVLGYFSEHFIKSRLFNPLVVTLALGIGGLLLIAVERLSFADEVDSLDHMQPRHAIRIGLFQCLALCPGVSRAASTIIGGMFTGMTRTAAAEFSFLAAVPVMVIVCLKDFWDIRNQLTGNELGTYAIGFAMAFITAILAVKGFIRLLQNTTMAPFGVYRIVVAVIFFWLLRGQSLGP